MKYKGAYGSFFLPVMHRQIYVVKETSFVIFIFYLIDKYE
jgi:hypothetical protein